MSQVGDFAARWGNETFAPPRDRVSAVIAARNHDEGWRTWEMQPELDRKTGAPMNFLDVPRAEHIKFYGIGVRFLESTYPRSALLVSRHATGLYLGRYGVDGERVPERHELSPTIRDFVDTQEKVQRKLSAVTLVNEAELLHDYRLLQAWDRLSICFCLGRDESRLGPVPTNDGGGVPISARRIDELTVSLSPFPFPDLEQSFPVRIFELPGRRFGSSDELNEVLASTSATVANFHAVAE